MLFTLSFQKSLIVEQFYGNYLKTKCCTPTRYKQARGYSQKNWMGAPARVPKQYAILGTLFMTRPKIRNPIYDLTKNLMPYFRPLHQYPISGLPIISFLSLESPRKFLGP